MKKCTARMSGGLIAAISLALAASVASAATTTVIATGLNNPRGLTFSSNGTLYVAEAGSGGSGQCITNSNPELVCFGYTGSITELRMHHHKGVVSWQQKRIVTGLPSLAATDGTTAVGADDISALGNGRFLIALGMGAPPCNTDPTVPGPCGVAESAAGLLQGTGLATLIRLNGHSGKWTTIADLAAYEQAENPDGTDHDTDPYGVLALPGANYIADAGANDVLKVTNSGKVSTVAVLPRVAGMWSSPPFPPSPTDSVPTAVAQSPDGMLFAGELTGVPFPVGASRVYELTEAGPVVYCADADGFTNVVDITFDPQGNLYVLEISHSGLLSGMMDGALIEVSPTCDETTVISNIFSPGGVAIGPDGKPYVTINSILPGAGEVVRIDP